MAKFQPGDTVQLTVGCPDPVGRYGISQSDWDAHIYQNSRVKNGNPLILEGSYHCWPEDHFVLVARPATNVYSHSFQKGQAVTLYRHLRDVPVHDYFPGPRLFSVQDAAGSWFGVRDDQWANFLGHDYIVEDVSADCIKLANTHLWWPIECVSLLPSPADDKMWIDELADESPAPEDSLIAKRRELRKLLGF